MNCFNGQKLNILAAAFANALSEGLNEEEIELLSCFFQLVGQALTTITAANLLCDESKKRNINKSQNIEILET